MRVLVVSAVFCSASVEARKVYLDQIAVLAAKTNSWHPTTWAIVYIVVCLSCTYCLRTVWRRIRPPETVFQELELDDMRIERFDGIEQTLMRRLRDPFGYSPLTNPMHEDAGGDIYENQADKYLGRVPSQQQQDSFEVREAANSLRSRAMNMVFNLTGDSAGSTGGLPSIEHQEAAQRAKVAGEDQDTFAKNWQSRLLTDKEKEAAFLAKKENMSAEEKEAEKALKAKQRSEDPYRHAKGGAKGRGGGSNWDAWGDETAWEGSQDKPVESPDTKAQNKGMSEQKEHKADSYHSEVGGPNTSDGNGNGNGNNAGTDASASANNNQFGPRKVGAFTLAGGDQWASVRGRGPPAVGSPSGAGLAVNAAGGSFSQGSGTLARQNTMQATGAGSGLTGKTVIDSPLQRSPDKKGGLTLDLSRVARPAGPVWQ